MLSVLIANSIADANGCKQLLPVCVCHVNKLLILIDLILGNRCSLDKSRDCIVDAYKIH